MKYLGVLVGVALVLALAATVAMGETVTFNPSDVVNMIGGLHNATDQWGLWAVRARPVVTGGSYTITGASTTQTGWGTSAPSWYSWNTYGTNCAWFYDESGAEAKLPSNPLYMIMDVSQDNFWSSSFNKNGSWVGDWSPGGGGTWYDSGYDDGKGGTNRITAVGSGSQFSFSFTLGGGASWCGEWQFLVDGSRYSLGTYDTPGVWQEDFFGDYGTGGGLAGNTGAGYTTPEPLTMLGLALGLGSVGAYIRRRRMV